MFTAPTRRRWNGRLATTTPLYEAGLGPLADAAIRWIATGEDFDALRDETAKAGAIEIARDPEAIQKALQRG